MSFRGGGTGHMLPLHSKNGNPAVKLQSAFDKGMSMAGLKATKGGSGEKEKAYVVRQNWVLKTLLLLIVIFAVGMMVLFSTVLKVSVTRRQALKSEKLHHQLEHAAQVKLMRAHLELQRALEKEVHETSRLEEFRSMADRALGDHAEKLKKVLTEKGANPDIIKEVESADEKLRDLLDLRMHSILQHFQRVANEARNSLKRVAHAIVSDVELEKKESDRYKEKMKKDFGVEVSEEEEHNPHHKKEDGDEYGLFQQERQEEQREGEGENEEDPEEVDEKEIAQELERFFAKLQAHTFPLLSRETIDDWEKDMSEINTMLNDEGKEMDLESLTSKVNQKIAMFAPDAEKYDPAKHSSIVDYFEMRIEEAKLAFHRQALMDLYNGWKEDGKISPYTVLSGLEHIAEENSMYLLYEWLDGAEGDLEQES